MPLLRALLLLLGLRGGGAVPVGGKDDLLRSATRPRSYAVIFDAGSTGTRVHVFSWSNRGGPSVDGLPDVRAEPGGNLKVKPGISSFESSPEDAGASILKLIELAERVVPKEEHSHALVLLRATAGMRVLSRRRAQRIYASLYEMVSRRGTFRPRRQDFGTLSGDDEGVFGWLSANYLLRRAGKIAEMGAIGALDLGGGSTQITLALPAGSASRHAQDRSQIDPRHGIEQLARSDGAAQGAPAPTVALPAGDVRIFTHSHLGYGNKAVLTSLSAAEASACLAAGANVSWEPCNRSRDYQKFLAAGAVPMMLTGEGDFQRCDAAVRRVLRSFDQHGQPSVHQSPPSRFVAMSLFFYVRHFAQVSGNLPHSGSPSATATAMGSASGSVSGSAGGAGTSTSAAALRQAARSLCEYDDTKLRTLVGKDPLTTEEALLWRCFDLTYASRLLTDAYGFQAEAAVIDFMGDIDGVEVEWTLGALLNEILLTAKASGAQLHIVGSSGSSYGASTVLKAAALLVAAAFLLLVVPRMCSGPRNHARAARSRVLSKW